MTAASGRAVSTTDGVLMLDFVAQPIVGVRKELRRPLLAVLLPSFHLSSCLPELLREGVPAFLAPHRPVNDQTLFACTKGVNHG